jgi:hypothetical protein
MRIFMRSLKKRFDTCGWSWLFHLNYYWVFHIEAQEIKEYEPVRGMIECAKWVGVIGPKKKHQRRYYWELRTRVDLKQWWRQNIEAGEAKKRNDAKELSITLNEWKITHTIMIIIRKVDFSSLFKLPVIIKFIYQGIFCDYTFLWMVQQSRVQRIMNNLHPFLWHAESALFLIISSNNFTFLLSLLYFYLSPLWFISFDIIEDRLV